VLGTQRKRRITGPHRLLSSFENSDEVSFLLAASSGPRKADPFILIKVDTLHNSSVRPDQKFA
jgi:hypothetical protein